MGAIPSHRNPHLFMDAGQHFLPEAVKVSLLASAGPYLQWRWYGYKNQCHEPSSTLFIHLASSSLHLGGDLLDNHSAVSISLKNVKQTRDRRCISGQGLRRLGSTGTVESTAALCSTTDNIAVPSCTTTNEWTIWSGSGDDA